MSYEQNIQQPPSKQHTIFYSGGIYPQSANNIRSTMIQALHQNASSIRLILSSEGGDLNTGLSLYHFLRALPIPLTTYNFGTIESIALLIYMAADTRLVANDAWFLIHSFNANFIHTGVDYPRLVERTSSIGQHAETYAKIICDKTRDAKNPIDIRKALNGEALIIDSYSACSAGIATDVVSADSIITVDDANWWVAP